MQMSGSTRGAVDESATASAPPSDTRVSIRENAPKMNKESSVFGAEEFEEEKPPKIPDPEDWILREKRDERQKRKREKKMPTKMGSSNSRREPSPLQEEEFGAEEVEEDPPPSIPELKDPFLVKEKENEARKRAVTTARLPTRREDQGTVALSSKGGSSSPGLQAFRKRRKRQAFGAEDVSQDKSQNVSSNDIRPGAEWIGEIEGRESMGSIIIGYTATRTGPLGVNTRPSEAKDYNGVDMTYLPNVLATVVDEGNIIEATEVVDPAKERRRHCLYLVLMILLLVVVVAVVVPVVVIQTGGLSTTVVVNATASPTPTPSASPSLSTTPSFWPTSLPSASPTPIVQALLTSSSLDGGAALAQSGSPQEQALLLIQEELVIEPDMSVERILQRYALETLYFSTDGPQWNNARWIIGVNEVFPGGRFVDEECTWSGVTCNRNNAVAELDLSSVGLFGPLPDEIILLSQLTFLHLPQNSLVRSIPVGLQRMSNLESLDLSDNHFQFGFSSELGSMTSLQYLNFFANGAEDTQFLWALPTEIGLLKHLRALLFGETVLGGEIVSEIGKLTQLTSLSFSTNFLVGTIPSELGMLTRLVRLELHNNQLTGTIPTELGHLVRLSWLSVDQNRLTGTIPSELGLMTDLTTLNLVSIVVAQEMNDFTGSVPQQVCDAVAPNYIGLGCYQASLTCLCSASICRPLCS